MTIAWISTLPQSLSGSGNYQEAPEKTVIRTATDSGITRSRRRQTRAESQISGTMDLTSAQVIDFIDYYDDVLAGGSLTFQGALGRQGVTQTYLFAEEPTVSHLGGDVYTLSLKLIVKPT
jgi:hypothetical protein